MEDSDRRSPPSSILHSPSNPSECHWSFRALLTDNEEVMTALIQQVVGGWPRASESAEMVIILGGVAGGVFLWIAGARFSQSLIALVAVAAGAMLGLRMPGWLGWPIASWATAVLIALVFGVCGFAMHQLWAGIGLALLLGLWAGGAAIANSGLVDSTFTFAPPAGRTLVDSLSEAWYQLPPDLRRVGPFVCGTGLAVGLGLTLLWSRMATILLYSMLGATAIVGFGWAAMAIRRPGLLRFVPSDQILKWSIFAGMVLIGVFVQWRMAPRPAMESPAQEPVKKEPVR